MRVLLADDHAMIRDGLRAVLEKQRGVVVVGETPDGRDAIAQVLRLRPDVVVMDVGMPELNGIDATRRIIAEAPGTKVIALSMHSDRRYVLAMFAAGAMAYLLKDGAASELLQALDAVSRNRKYVSPQVADAVLPGANGEVAAAPPASALSAREREVLQLLAEGRTSKEIAVSLCIALPTVESHRRQITSKVNIRTVAELTKYAIREGLTRLEK